MATIRRTSAAEVASLREQYTASLTAPLDGMWEAFAGLASHWEICRAGERIGYFCVDDAERLLQFHLAASFEEPAQECFAGAVREGGVRGAMVSSFEPWLPLCLDLNREVRVHTLLYHDQPGSSPSASSHEGLDLQVVSESERGTIEEFVRRCFTIDPGDWLSGYLERLVARGELLALRESEKLLGTGELRVSDSQPPYADLGVIVAPEQRGRGLATRILWRLKRLCREAGLVPICSTTVDNTGARRAIAKAGFGSRHRLLEVLF